jgi:hypothetical protein
MRKNKTKIKKKAFSEDIKKQKKEYKKYMPLRELILNVGFAFIVSLCLFAYFFGSEAVNFFNLSAFFGVYVATLIIVRIPVVINTAKKFKNENAYAKRFFSDAGLRLKAYLYYSILLNLIFSVLQLYLGGKNKSAWFYVLGIYYGFLVVVRLILVNEARKNTLGSSPMSEHRCCRFCGVLICMMDVAVGSIVYSIVAEGKGFRYNYLITAFMAVYVLFILTSTIINLVKWENNKTPVIYVSEWVNLVEALMCVIFFETSLLSLLVKEENYQLRRFITVVSGVGVFLSVFVVSLLVFIKSSKEIRKLKKAV